MNHHKDAKYGPPASKVIRIVPLEGFCIVDPGLSPVNNATLKLNPAELAAYG